MAQLCPIVAKIPQQPTPPLGERDMYLSIYPSRILQKHTRNKIIIIKVVKNKAKIMANSLVGIARS